jgi:hypothetical protein
VTCAPGRTLQQKARLLRAHGRRRGGRLRSEPSDVIIHLVETLRENWSFGEGVAHYTL